MPVMRLLADRGDQLARELSQLLGDQEGISAAAHIQHPVVVQVEACLEAVVAAQDLHRQPGRHDLGDGGRDEGLVGVLGDQLVALVVHHEHQPRRSQRRDLLLGAGQGRGGQQEQGEGETGETTWRLQSARRFCLMEPGKTTLVFACISLVGDALSVAAACKR